VFPLFIAYVLAGNWILLNEAEEALSLFGFAVEAVVATG
jgi:hypothetical protein